jgi:hypothetical protein
MIRHWIDGMGELPHPLRVKHTTERLQYTGTLQKRIISRMADDVPLPNHVAVTGGYVAESVPA